MGRRLRFLAQLYEYPQLRCQKTWLRGKNIGTFGSTLSDMFIDLLNILMFCQFEVLTPLKALILAFFTQEGSFQVTL